MLWPRDKSWFVATHIDFDSTLIGGTQVIIDALRASFPAAFLRVEPDNSLSMTADRVNGVA